MKYKKLHIGFICNEYPGVGSDNGGIGAFTQTLGRSLIEKGHTVSVFGVYKSLKKEVMIDDAGIKAIGVPYLRIPKISWEFNRWRLMRRIKAEHKINSLSILEAPDYQGWLRKIKINIPIIIRIHSPLKVGFVDSIDTNKLPNSIISEEKSIKYANYLCSCGESVAKAARLTYLNNLSSEIPIKVIHNSIDTNYFSQKEKKIETNINIVFAGRLSVKKGVLELVKSWNKIIKEFSNARLFIIGRDSEHGDLKSMASELKALISPEISNTVTFIGFVNSEKILHYFQKASICVFPSHREAFSVVILEAMATGTPVVYSKIEPAYEIIEDGLNGILCNPYDPDDIASKIIYLLKDQTLMRKIGDNARAHVENKFSINSIVNKNLDFYKNCIENYYQNKF